MFQALTMSNQHVDGADGSDHSNDGNHDARVDVLLRDMPGYWPFTGSGRPSTRAHEGKSHRKDNDAHENRARSSVHLSTVTTLSRRREECLCCLWARQDLNL